MKKQLLLIALCCFFPSVVFGSSIDGTIDSQHQYAWSTHLGWFNFAAEQGNIHVTDAGLTGYLWSQNYGWVNLASTNSGVKNDGEGHLSGFAWGENLGWGDYAGVTIDADGMFHGSVRNVNLNLPSLNFDCDHCSVKTDWRPLSSRPKNEIIENSEGNKNNGGGNSVGLPPASSIASNVSPVIPFIVPTEVSPNSTPQSSEKNIPSPTVSLGAPFQRNFILGNRHTDVKRLQQFLNAIGFRVAKSGSGSVGHETNNYGRLTANAVKKFQKANNITPVGVVGPLTREALNRYDFLKGS